MKVFKRKKAGNYWIYLSYKGRVLRESLKTLDRREAERLAKEIEVRILHAGWGFVDARPAKLEDLQFSKFFEEKYFPELKDTRKESTAVACHGKFTRHLAGFFKNTPISQITASLIDDFKKVRKDEIDDKRRSEREAAEGKGEIYRKEAYSEINRELALLRAVLNFAVRKNFIPTHPFQKRQVDFFTEPPSPGQSITREEEARLMECADYRLKPIILMALYTGRRMGEILGLRWPQVDLDNQVIKFEDTKENQIVEVPLTNQLTEMLKSAKIDKLFDSDYVFCHHTSDIYKGKRYCNINKWWNQARRDAKLVKPFKERSVRFHDLRHSFVSRARELGFSDPEVMSLTGHKELDTLRRYTHPSSERKRMMVQLLEINTETAKNLHKSCTFSEEGFARKISNSATNDN